MKIFAILLPRSREERKGETMEKKEIRVSFTHLRFAIRSPLPPCTSIRNSSTLLSLLLLGAAHTQTAREAGPSQAANWGHRVLFMCVIPWKTSPIHPHYAHTHIHRQTHLQTHSHVFSLRAMAIVWQLLPSLPWLPLLLPPSIISVMSFRLVVLASFAGCVVLL